MRPDTTPTWVAAAGTIAAVLVALFGPGVRAWWSRPRLSLRPNDENLGGEELIFAGDESDARAHVISLVLANHGRRQADQVEAVLTVSQTFGPIPPDDDGTEEIPAFDLPTVGRGALRFELSDPDRPTITVPPGAERTLHFVLLGRADEVLAALKDRGDPVPGTGPDVPDLVGTFVLWPVAHADRTTWILDDTPLDVSFTITARNARARTWTARVKAWAWSGMKDEPSDLSGIKLEWLQRPRRTRRSPTPPSPARTWVANHTPWALIAAARFEREMKALRREGEEHEPPPR